MFPAAPPAPAAISILALGVTQTIAWASSTYLPAILAAPMASSVGHTVAEAYVVWSLALLLMAALGPSIGRMIDRHGGRPVLMASNLVLACGLFTLASATAPWALVLGSLLLGVGMALGLYDAAFAALVRHFGATARGPITGITLLGGFASTIGWPLSSWLLGEFGWRLTCAAWALIHLLLALPINALCLPRTTSTVGSAALAPAHQPGAPSAKAPRGAMVLLAIFGAATAFVTSAMSAHLPGFLVLCGLGTGAALFAASLFGPAQVAARLFEYFVLHRLRLHPLIGARLATSLQPLGALCLLLFGGTPLAGAAYALLYGAGNGMITIAKGTLPLALFGPEGYGERQGLLAIAPRLMLAAAPAVFGYVMQAYGATFALALTVLVSLLALLSLALLRAKTR